jgi:hypothetical protein
MSGYCLEGRILFLVKPESLYSLTVISGTDIDSLYGKINCRIFGRKKYPKLGREIQGTIESSAIWVGQLSAYGSIKSS